MEKDLVGAAAGSLFSSFVKEGVIVIPIK